MSAAARRLHHELAWVVGQLDKFEAQGLSDREAWSRLRFTEAPRTRKSLSRLAGVEQAIWVMAERSVVDRQPYNLGSILGSIAWDYVQEESNAVQAIDSARAARKDDGLDEIGTLEALKGVKTLHRSTRERWKAAYNLLGDGAEVWPTPDTKRGLRGALKSMYESLAGTKRDRVPKTRSR